MCVWQKYVFSPKSTVGAVTMYRIFLSLGSDPRIQPGVIILLQGIQAKPRLKAIDLVLLEGNLFLGAS
jgi:hypothetical protein